jgi:DNA-binding NtrC family response regulator
MRDLARTGSAFTPPAIAPLVGETAAMRALRREIARIAPTDASALITGETGTGKGLVARWLHQASERRERPFVHVDCAALAQTVIESELFGHERGAFTGAVEQRAGRLERAGTGTLFLDEIGELERPLQAKLLRVLQDREYERVGGDRTLALRARVLAATNQELETAIESGRFRADLYFRLSVFHLRIPPLRERIEDVALLVAAGLEPFARRLGRAAPTPTQAFLTRLEAHRWPGNVRELWNVLERLAARGLGDVLDAGHLDGILEDAPRTAPTPLVPAPAPRELSDAEAAERRRLAAALGNAGGNVSRVARRLGISRSTLRYRIRKYRLEPLIPGD